MALHPPVLVTDDLKEVRQLHCLMLEHFGIPTVEADSATETLRICRTHPIALVVSDVMKPDMNGYEMLAQLRANPVSRHIPLIFVSARTWRKQDIADAMRLGASRCLSKPIHPRLLVAEVRAVLETHGISYAQRVR